MASPIRYDRIKTLTQLARLLLPGEAIEEGDLVRKDRTYVELRKGDGAIGETVVQGRSPVYRFCGPLYEEEHEQPL